MSTADIHIARRTFSSEMARKVQSLRDAASTEVARLGGYVEALQDVASAAAAASPESEAPALSDWTADKVGQAVQSQREQAGRCAMGDMLLQLLQADFEQSGATLQAIQSELAQDEGKSPAPASKAAQCARAKRQPLRKGKSRAINA